MDKLEINILIDQISSEINKNPNISKLYFERGKLYWKLNLKSEAITDFNTAVSIDPNSPAKTYLDMSTDIMNFYNTDLYNP